jgi:hypothetical protein
MYWKAGHIWTAEGLPYPTARSIIYLYGKAVRIALSTVLRKVCFISGLANDTSKLKTRASVGALCTRIRGIMLVYCVLEHMTSHSRTVSQNIWPHIRALCARTFGLTFSLCVPEHLASHSRCLPEHFLSHSRSVLQKIFPTRWSLRIHEINWCR